MSSREPSAQFVAACLLEGCKPVPVDAVVVGRCEGCSDQAQCDLYPLLDTACQKTFGCTHWKPRETVSEDERK